VDNRGIFVRFSAQGDVCRLSTPGAHAHFYSGDHSPTVKPLGHEGDRSPRGSTEVKNAWMSTSTPPHMCAKPKHSLGFHLSLYLKKERETGLEKE